MNAKILIGAGVAVALLAVAAVGSAQAHKKSTTQMSTDRISTESMAGEKMPAEQMMAASDAKKAPFGNKDDIAYAQALWKAMVEARLAGPDAIATNVYEGQEPHGAALETLFSSVSVNGHTGTVAVKRNYGPAGVDTDVVSMNPAKHLGAVTVMFKREKGYDTENKNWFWVKYLPDGSLDKNPKGMKLAGRVAKGANKGCIACHSLADGDDMVYTNVAIRD